MPTFRRRFEEVVKVLLQEARRFEHNDGEIAWSIWFSPAEVAYVFFNCRFTIWFAAWTLQSQIISGPSGSTPHLQQLLMTLSFNCWTLYDFKILLSSTHHSYQQLWCLNLQVIFPSDVIATCNISYHVFLGLLYYPSFWLLGECGKNLMLISIITRVITSIIYIHKSNYSLPKKGKT